MRKIIMTCMTVGFFMCSVVARADDIASLKERIERLEERTMIEDEKALRPYWDGRLRMVTDDGRFNVHLRGRLHYDLAFWGHKASDIEDNIGPLGDRTLFRRARLGTRGTLWGSMDYMAEWDFAGSDASVRDAYLQLKNMGPLGSLRMGHFKEPFSLEELTSSNNITFMERSLPVQFAPSRNFGFLLQNRVLDGRMTWAAGLYDQGDDNIHGDWAATARVTGTPYYVDGGDKLVHLGIAASQRGSGDDDIRYRARPEIRTERFIDTRDAAGNDLEQSGSSQLLGLEAAVKMGSASLQGEYIMASPSLAGQSDPTFDGYYVTGSYVLTGESRGYSGGSFGGVTPRQNAFENGGIGAWEIALRYSNIDLNNKNVDGGEMNNITAGVNWYLNPNSRFMLNYVNSETKRDDFNSSSARAEAYMMRFQVSF